MEFFQCASFFGVTGSAYGPTTKDLRIIYIVNSLPEEGARTEDDLTFKIEAKSEASAETEHQAVFGHYAKCFRFMLDKRRVRSLGSFSQSLWDKSAEAWADYCQNCLAVTESVEGLIQFAQFRDGEEILDLGCGTGKIAQVILDRSPGHGKQRLPKITCLDASPQMLKSAKVSLGNARGVTFALCEAPSASGPDKDLGDAKYSAIIIHNSIPSLAMGYTLQRLAHWCRERLGPKGRVFVVGHNGLFRMKAPRRWRNWSDPFRKCFKEACRELGIQQHLRQTTPAKLTTEQLDDAFRQVGFEKTQRVPTREFEITVDDRLKMWRAPAVCNCLLDMEHVSIEEATAVLDKVAMRLSPDTEMMPRFVSYHCYTLPSGKHGDRT